MSFKIKNLTDSNKRVALKANQDFLPSVEGETNVTTILTPNALSFCLSENVDNTISCVGATNSAILALIVNSNYTIVPAGFLFEIDGVQEALITNENGSNFEAFSAKFPNLEFGGGDEGEATLRNKSTTQNLRLKIKGYPLDQNGYTLSFINNPTSGFDNGWATVCLSPSLPISGFNCEGASNSIGIKWGSDLFTSSSIITINGIEFLNPPSIDRSSEGQYTLGDFTFNSKQSDGSIGLASLNNEMVHIKIKFLEESLSQGFSEYSQTEFEDSWNDSNINPTYTMDLNSKTIEFCLAPKIINNLINCEGATNSARFTNGSGTWDIEVNGVLYQSPDGYGLGHFISSNPFLSNILEGGGDGDFLINSLSTSDNLRIRLIPRDYERWEINESNLNPTVVIESNGVISFCLAPAEPELIQYVLTIDDKGLVPSDGIYSGTITPPLPSAILSFNIQQYLPNGSNGRIFNVQSDAQGLVVSPNGATWKIDRANLASWWVNDFPTASDFTEPATYKISLHKMMGDENIVSGELAYIVESTIPCQPTILALPTGNFPARLPSGGLWTFTYRVNGGAIQTHLENAYDVPMATVLVNFLGYYSLFSILVSNGGAPTSRAFLAMYGHSIMGGSATDPDRTSIQSNTIELLVNPNASYDAVELIFGQSVMLHSCALIDWTKKGF